MVNYLTYHYGEDDFMAFIFKSYRSMAKMRVIAPEMQRMKEEFGEDRMRFSQEMMALYKREQVNPLSGCLPLLLQMPIFPCFVLGTHGKCGITSCTVVRLDSRFVCDGPMVHLAINYGCDNVCSANVEPATS